MMTFLAIYAVGFVASFAVGCYNLCRDRFGVAGQYGKRAVLCGLAIMGFLWFMVLPALAFNAIRLRAKGKEGAMYDRANPTVGMNPDGSARTDGLYRNRGTGAFLYGSDKTA